jgi:hypothetical protein
MSLYRPVAGSPISSIEVQPLDTSQIVGLKFDYWVQVNRWSEVQPMG